jgi:very-short-patch-repair endonuclease
MSINALDSRIAALAATQHGAVCTNQLIDLGARPRQRHHRIERGSLVQVADNVFIAAGSPRTALQRIHVALLDAPGTAVVSHLTAANLWGIPGFLIDKIHLIGPRGSAHHQDRIAKIHEPRLLLPSHLSQIHRLTVTTPSRTIFDIAAMPSTSPRTVERLLDTCLARRLVTLTSINKTLTELQQRGRKGIVLIRTLISDRRTNYRPVESNLEFRFRELTRRSGISDLFQQVDVSAESGWVGRVDFVHPRKKLIVEVDGEAFHGSLSAKRTDARRDDALTNAGWKVLRLTDVDLFHRPDQVVQRLRRASQNADRYKQSAVTHPTGRPN